MLLGGAELTRFDIAVCFLAVECCLGKNDFGLALYQKMQECRLGDGCGEKAAAQFCALVDSYERNGYDSESLICLDKNLALVDGSCRIALGLYYGMRSISALVINVDSKLVSSDFSMDWFLANGFADEEVSAIADKAQELLKACNSPFSCIIWSTALSLQDEIIRDLKRYGSVESIKRYSYGSFEEFANVVRAIYKIDPTAAPADKKLDRMKACSTETVVVDLRLDNLAFRVKNAVSTPVFVTIERMKRAIRLRYKSRLDNCFPDAGLHVADNFTQDRYTRHILEPSINARDIFSILSEFKYALIKVDVPRTPAEFPDKICSGQDMDILSSKGDMAEIVERLASFYKDCKDYDIRVRVGDKNAVLDFRLYGERIFAVDCQCTIGGLPQEFFEVALQCRVHDERGFYRLDAGFEALLRKAVFGQHPHKWWHNEYYLAHKDEAAEAEKKIEEYSGKQAPC